MADDFSPNAFLPHFYPTEKFPEIFRVLFGTTGWRFSGKQPFTAFARAAT